MKSLWTRIQTEPALVSGFIAAALALAAAFGLRLTGDQIGTILAIVSAGLALLVRSQVTPTAHLPATVTNVYQPPTVTMGAPNTNPAGLNQNAGTANITFPPTPRPEMLGGTGVPIAAATHPVDQTDAPAPVVPDPPAVPTTP